MQRSIFLRLLQWLLQFSTHKILIYTKSPKLINPIHVSFHHPLRVIFESRLVIWQMVKKIWNQIIFISWFCFADLNYLHDDFNRYNFPDMSLYWGHLHCNWQICGQWNKNSEGLFICYLSQLFCRHQYSDLLYLQQKIQKKILEIGDSRVF